jgi:hypothetical protein
VLKKLLRCLESVLNLVNTINRFHFFSFGSSATCFCFLSALF